MFRRPREYGCGGEAIVARWDLKARDAIGPAVTLAALALAEAIARAGAPFLALVLLPPGLVVIVVVFTTGLRVGLASAFLFAAYALAMPFVRPGDPFGVGPVALDRILLDIAFLFVGVLIIGELKDRAERASARAIDEHREATARERERVAALQASNRSLSRANEALEAFSYMASHDLKEPVRAVDAYLTALEEDHGDALPGDARALVRRARDATERLDALVRALLDMSRASRISPQDLHPVNVGDLLATDRYRTRFERVLRARDAHLEVVPGIPDVSATPDMLGQILGNLILNALNHNPVRDPRVQVAGEDHADGFVEITVSDNGPGFPPDTLSRFAREDDAPSGQGFGLTIARRTVERLGGRLWLANHANGGAEVHLVLPAARHDA